MKNLRSPICVIVGHIDHGKSSILDRIRNTNIIASEAGGITQAISFTNLNSKRIKQVCGTLLDALKVNLTLPGILFLDTPGHAAFNNLRKRGGNLADIAVLVIDVTKGIEEQSIESINILKQYKTPFIIAANKIDLLPGWQKKDDFLLKNINLQGERTRQELDNKLYGLVGKLSGLGFNSERFDRVDDYTKGIAIVPVSAKTNEGISELLMVISGLAQKYLENNLVIDKEANGKGTILEVKEEKAGTIIYAVVYDGNLKKNDQLVIGGVNEAVVTKIRAIFISDEKFKFKEENEITASAGIKILASNVKDVLSGMPFIAANKNLDKVKEDIQKEVEEVLIQTDGEGIVVKADTLGSLEALINLLKKSGIQIKKATIGSISKKDISDAMAENDEMYRVILGFNVSSIETTDVKIITNEVIYRLIEDYENWKKAKLEEQERNKLENVTRPCKIQILPGCIFRQSNPAVVGVVVLGGLVKNNTTLMKLTGEKISEIKSLQLEGENIEKAEKNKEIAISLPNAVVGRHIRERDILISDIIEDDFIKLKQLKKYLNRDEIELLKEIANIKRKKDPLWGI